jgi:AcrR family transcriptional regulator
MPIPAVVSHQSGSGGPTTASRIRAAAMKCFANHGTEATSLRMVAMSAGVSIGLVQHHFGSKAALIKAVDDQLMTIVHEAAPISWPTLDPLTDMGHRATALIAEHPDAIDYLAHLLIEDTSTGRDIFDELFGIGKRQWDDLRKQGHLRPDLDPKWGALNPLILVLGTLILRSHIERQLAQPFTAPTQLREWGTAVGNLIDGGQLRKRSSKSESPLNRSSA